MLKREKLPVKSASRLLIFFLQAHHDAFVTNLFLVLKRWAEEGIECRLMDKKWDRE